MLGQHLVRGDVVAASPGCPTTTPLPLAGTGPAVSPHSSPSPTLQRRKAGSPSSGRVAPDAAGHHHPADAQTLARRRQLLRLALLP